MFHSLLRLALLPLLAASATAQSTTAAAPAAASPAAASKPTPAELAYWAQLQRELDELRRANLALGLRQSPLETSAENISAIVSRLEKFLDRRDQDPVADLGADYKEYRERVMKLCDLALTPLTAAAKFKATVVTDGEQRMMQTFTIFKAVSALDDHKPRLVALHDQLDARAVSAGAEPQWFFQVIGIGDKPRAAGALGSPEERDAQFVKDATAIGPIYADLAKGHFVAHRVKDGLTEGLMDPLLESAKKFREQFADAPNDQLQEALRTAPSLQEKPGTFVLKRHLLRLELARRAEPVAHTIALQEFQGAFRRWLGQAADIAPLGLCRDVAVAHDGAWFAHVGDERTVVVRDAATGKVRVAIPAPDPVRSLAAARDGRIMIFTAAGLFSADPAAPKPALELRAARRSAFLEARLAGASGSDRFVYGLGVMPAMARNGAETTFSMEKNASRITAVGIDAEGLTLAYGYAGDNLTGTGQRTYGVDILRFPAGDLTTAEGTKIDSSRVSPPLTFAALALDFSADGRQLAAAWFGYFGGSVTLDDLSGSKPAQRIFTLDGDSYTWVRLLPGTPLRVAAATRHGAVRIWNAETRDLLVRFDVPAGPSGLACTVVGGDLVTVALGRTAVHRWKLADGTHLAAYAGDKPVPGPSALAAELALAPIREELIALLQAADEPTRIKQLETLRTTHAAQVDAVGQRRTVEHWLGRLRTDQVVKLRRDKRRVEAFELGAKEIASGVVTAGLSYATIAAGNGATYDKPDPAFRARVVAFARRAVELFPNDNDLRAEFLLARSGAFAAEGKVTEALADIDRLNAVWPDLAPHAGQRFNIYVTAHGVALKAGRKAEAMRHLIGAIDFADGKPSALNLARNVFGLAYELKDWKTAVQFANVSLNLDPALKNDQNFMAAARYAYGQANPQPAPAPKKK
jgi:tetratricopeptide (TPR) repeat protein